MEVFALSMIKDTARNGSRDRGVPEVAPLDYRKRLGRETLLAIALKVRVDSPPKV